MHIIAIYTAPNFNGSQPVPLRLEYRSKDQNNAIRTEKPDELSATVLLYDKKIET